MEVSAFNREARYALDVLRGKMIESIGANVVGRDVEKAVVINGKPVQSLSNRV